MLILPPVLLSWVVRQCKLRGHTVALDNMIAARVAALLAEMASLPCFYGCPALTVNSAGSAGDTPLIVALIRADLRSTLDLLAAGADPDAIGEDGFAPLHWAAKAEVEFVRPLVARGAVSRVDVLFGDTPQDIAGRSGDAELIVLLGGSPDTDPGAAADGGGLIGSRR